MRAIPDTDDLYQHRNAVAKQLRQSSSSKPLITIPTTRTTRCCRPLVLHQKKAAVTNRHDEVVYCMCCAEEVITTASSDSLTVMWHEAMLWDACWLSRVRERMLVSLLMFIAQPRAHTLALSQSKFTKAIVEITLFLLSKIFPFFLHNKFPKIQKMTFFPIDFHFSNRLFFIKKLPGDLTIFWCPVNKSPSDHLTIHHHR